MCTLHVTRGYLGKAYPEGENPTGAQADIQQVFKTVPTQKVTSALKIFLRFLLCLGKSGVGDGFPNTSLFLVEHGYKVKHSSSVIASQRSATGNRRSRTGELEG